MIQIILLHVNRGIRWSVLADVTLLSLAQVSCESFLSAAQVRYKRSNTRKQALVHMKELLTAASRVGGVTHLVAAVTSVLQHGPRSEVTHITLLSYHCLLTSDIFVNLGPYCRKLRFWSGEVYLYWSHMWIYTFISWMIFKILRNLKI